MLQKKQIFIIVGFVILSFFLAKQVLFFKKGLLEKLAHNISYPVLIAANYATKPIKNLFKTIKQYKNLKNKYLKLKKEHDQVCKEHVKLCATKQFHDSISQLVQFQDQYKLQNIKIAKIILKNISQAQHHFLINKGAKDGIKKDMVALHEFQIIGRVTDVHSYYSKVTLITDSNSKISAYTNRTKNTGIVQGNNDIKICNLSYVSHLSKIQDGEFVISSGQGLIFPEGFCLGRITKHKKKNLYHKIKIKPLVNLKEIDSCMILNREGK